MELKTIQTGDQIRFTRVIGIDINTSFNGNETNIHPIAVNLEPSLTLIEASLRKCHIIFYY